MDFLDEVLGIEEKAFEEGVRKSKEKALERVRVSSFNTGYENGRVIGREVGRIKMLARMVSGSKRIDKLR